MLTKPDLNKPAFKIFLKERASVDIGLCPFCGKEIKDGDFRDALSEKEYGVSGLCQECQDSVFGA